jgi:hypothetical protein
MHQRLGGDRDERDRLGMVDVKGVGFHPSEAKDRKHGQVLCYARLETFGQQGLQKIHRFFV